MADTQNGEESRTLAYPSWGTFNTTLDHFAAVGIPNEIDRNTLPATLSGASRYEVLGAFQFFELIDKQRKPNVAVFKKLVDSNTRREALLELLKRYYAGLFGLPLVTAGPTEVNKWFAQNATASTAGRSKAFFIRAAKASGVKMHTLVEKGTRASGPRKKGGKKRDRDNGAGTLELPPYTPPVTITDGLADKLLAKFPEFDPTWSSEVQQKWFDAFSKIQDQLKN